MDNTETLHNQKWSLQKPLASESKQTSSNQYRWSLVLVVMDNIQTFHFKRMVTAETVGFRFEEDFFLVQIVIGFGCHAQHCDVSPQEHGCCRTRWYHVRSRPLQISTDYHWLLLSCTTLKRFTTRKWFLQKPLFFFTSEQICSNQYRWSQAFVVMDNTETFQHQYMVAAESVGFRFEADLFKSVQLIIGFGCHGQAWDISE